MQEVNADLKDALNKILSMLSQSFMDVQDALTQSGRTVTHSKFHMDSETGLGSWEVDTARYTISCQMDLTLLYSDSQASSGMSGLSSWRRATDINTETLENVASVPDCEHSQD